MNSEITPTIKHIRLVKWLRMTPRSQLDQDLLFPLGIIIVCQIKRNDVENHVRKILEKGGSVERNITTVESAELSKEPDAAEIVDIEQHAKDQILKYVGVKFSGHDLARLVESILKSQGYITTKSEPGKDSGIDILAGSGPFGFNEPRICAHIQSFFDKFCLIIPDISPKRYDLR